ncbi:extracellular solute-binding protein [Paenibacillus roseipurpureus]|uniref:Extracellular solute-binding protein n=1 Tax=Paenibacillus roseopurpureus TaxID=2918901 RepID=A0AA96LKV8_9BACL|nr:extracellular solute-binding protein [Paenibacillus sp. MBLB1832]WNR42972.1 extracellular solute-binding protein [Paenibacillus sp. MBLB1832]
MNRTKLLSVLLGTALTLTACSGSKSGGESTSAAPSSKPKETPTVTIMMVGDISYPDDNIINKEIMKRTGVNVKWMFVPVGDFTTKLNTLIASNDLPDIIHNQDPKKVKELATNKMIVPLDDLLAKYGKNIKENKSDVLKGVNMINGKVYSIPQARDLGGESVAIRKDWLDKLGLKVPTNLDEYYTALKAFKEKDPDGNGKNDTVPLGVTMDYIKTMNHIFGAYGVPFDAAKERGRYIDGKVLPAFLQPGFLDAIKYYNKLYKEGLMEPDFSTIKAIPTYTKLWTGNVGTFNFQPPGTTQNWITRYTENPKPTFAYTVIKGPNGVGGQTKSYKEDGGPFVTLSANSKNPEAAMKVMDFLISDEGDKLTFCGIEGTHYKSVNNQCQYMDPFTDAVKQRNDGVQVYYGLMYRVNGAELRNFNELTKQGIQIARDAQLTDAHLSEIPEVEIAQGKIMLDIVKEFIAGGIVSKGNLDQEYETYKKKYLDAGGTKWIDQATAIYKKDNNIK